MANKRFIVKNGLDNSGDNSVVNTITNVAEPINNSDAATKYYVDTHTSGGTVTSVTATSPVESTGGTAPVISLGTGANGQLVIGTGTGFTKSTLTAGTGVSIANASGSVTISATGSGGDVVGPASSTDNAITRFDGTTGKIIQNSTATLSDGGIMVVTELDTDSIKSATANSPIVIAPDGTGDVHLNADSVRIGDNNADATIATRGTGDLIITTNEGSAVEGIVRLYDGVNGDITLTPNGTGQVKVGTDQVVTLVASQTLTNKTISGSSNTLSNIANASLTNSTISGVALGSNLNALTISSPLTGTSYNGSSAVSIGIPVATTSVSGYLSSTDWTTFNNKGSGSVTSVAATVPSLLSISGSPITTSGTLAITYSGTALPVANGGTGLTTLTAGYIPYGNGTSAFGSSADLFWDSTNSRLGIGTASPINKLTILGSTLASGELGSFAIVGSTTAKRLAFGVDSTGTMYGWIQSVESGVGYQNLNLQPLGGNLGVGTVAPADKLHVEGNIYLGTTSRTIYQGGSANLNFQVNTGQMVFLRSNGSNESMRIDSSGNVGIGTSSPVSRLHINKTGSLLNIATVGNDNNGFCVGVDTDGTGILATYASQGAIKFGGAISGGTFAGERMRIDSSGNVGIGTTAGYGGRINVVPATTPTTFATGNQIQIGEASSNTGYRLQLGYINEATAGYIGSIQVYAGGAAGNMTLQGVGGNVGIGTALPTQKIMLGGQTGATSTPLALQFSADWSNGYVAEKCKIYLYNGGGTGLWGFAVGPDNDIQYHSGGAGNTNGQHKWYTGNTERMRIDSSGNVGIGTASPTYRLQVSASDTSNVVGGSASAINITNSNAAAFNRTVDLNFSVGGGATSERIAGLSAVYTSYGTSVGGALAFCTNNGSSSFAERMRIDSSGNVGIGTTSPTNKLQVNGVMVGNNASGSYTKGFGGILTTTSTSTPTGGSSGDFALIY